MCLTVVTASAVVPSDSVTSQVAELPTLLSSASLHTTDFGGIVVPAKSFINLSCRPWAPIGGADISSFFVPLEHPGSAPASSPAAAIAAAIRDVVVNMPRQYNPQDTWSSRM